MLRGKGRGVMKEEGERGGRGDDGRREGGEVMTDGERGER